ncbi:hypothetical protein GJR95_06145 [Spirosoma endbachense]|uniref:Uncharacterized protein n=2 Tax=Spirosoma endbachense TaxID=2666025 RepID=A0A6P1VQC1_9BACT|nr:hypothetical protein GJR95_06145 [Spirosoma endbachense]
MAINNLHSRWFTKENCDCILNLLYKNSEKLDTQLLNKHYIRKAFGGSRLFSIGVFIFSLFTTSITDLQAQAQVLSISSLLKLTDLSRDEIEDFIMNKGYTFYDVKALNSNYMLYTYTSKLGMANTRVKSVMLVYYLDNTLVQAGFLTSSRTEYLELKRQIKELKYVFNSSKIGKDDWLTNFYSNPKKGKYTIKTRQKYLEQINSNEFVIEVTLVRL